MSDARVCSRIMSEDRAIMKREITINTLVVCGFAARPPSLARFILPRWGMVPESAREVSQAGKTGPAKVDVAERHRGRQRRVQSRDRHRQGGGTLAEESGDATR
ncbi:hypothetical protein ACS0PU_013027 [Formica fusca]